MVTKRQLPPELTYEEQVAIARANLDRHIAEMQAERERTVAQGIDPETAADAWLREHFTAEALLETWREHLASRGKRLADDLEALWQELGDETDARQSR